VAVISLVRLHAIRCPPLDDDAWVANEGKGNVLVCLFVGLFVDLFVGFFFIYSFVFGNVFM
jgi:hypothetical protein